MKNYIINSYHVGVRRGEVKSTCNFCRGPTLVQLQAPLAHNYNSRCMQCDLLTSTGTRHPCVKENMYIHKRINKPKKTQKLKQKKNSHHDPQPRNWLQSVTHFLSLFSLFLSLLSWRTAMCCKDYIWYLVYIYPILQFLQFNFISWNARYPDYPRNAFGMTLCLGNSIDILCTLSGHCRR